MKINETYEGLNGSQCSPHRIGICSRTVTVEMTDEFTLPDYQPEIRKLHKICTHILPPEVFVTADGQKVTVTGAVEYSVLYSDADGELCLSSISSDYTANAPVEIPSGYSVTDVSEAICDAVCVTDSVSGRVLGPRKLGIKQRLRCSVNAYAYGTIGCDVASGDGTETQLATTPVMRICHGESEVLHLEDEIITDSGEVRIVMPQHRVFIEELSLSRGELSVRGEVILKLLLCRESPDGEPYTAVRRIPFSTVVPMSDAADTDEACATGYVTELELEVGQGRIAVKTDVLVRATAQGNTTVSYVADCFSTRLVSVQRMAEYATRQALKCTNSNLSCGGTVTLEELGLPAGSSIIDCFASVLCTSTVLESEKRRLVTSGELRYSLLVFTGTETCVKDTTLPFRYECDVSGASVPSGSELVYEAHAEVLNTRCRIDGERVGLDSELAIVLCATVRCFVRAVSELELGEPLPEREATYTVCYPSAEDTLWSIAKRYSVSPAVIVEKNPFAKDLPKETKALIF